MKKNAEIIFPFKVSKGSVSVKIYRTPSRGCESFTLSYYQDGARKRPAFPNFGAAKAEADVVVRKLASCNIDVLQLTSADRAAYQRARHLLAGAVPRETGDKKIAIAQKEILRRKVVKIEEE